jgi:cell division protein ZapA (FtsZ GTPase activity inhibitor)
MPNAKTNYIRFAIITAILVSHFLAYLGGFLHGRFETLEKRARPTQQLRGLIERD